MAEDFKNLLDRELSEQHYQSFMEEHTRLIPREFVQNHGVHLSTVFRKIPFGADYKSDFFYLSKSSDDWNCVFIELEKPQTKFFKSNSNAFHQDFQHGLDQINTWRAWMTKPANVQSFIDTTVGNFRIPMERNPCFMKYLLVTGRRSEYGSNELRRSLVRAKETDDFKIITYDSLLENLMHKSPLFVAARQNEFVKILSTELVGEQIFSWMEPENIKVSQKLLDQIKKHKSNAHRGDRNGSFMESFRFVEDKLLTYT